MHCVYCETVNLLIYITLCPGQGTTLFRKIKSVCFVLYGISFDVKCDRFRRNGRLERFFGTNSNRITLIEIIWAKLYTPLLTLVFSRKKIMQCF